jgi:hypothetical protein
MLSNLSAGCRVEEMPVVRWTQWAYQHKLRLVNVEAEEMLINNLMKLLQNFQVMMNLVRVHLEL